RFVSNWFLKNIVQGGSWISGADSNAGLALRCPRAKCQGGGGRGFSYAAFAHSERQRNVWHRPVLPFQFEFVFLTRWRIDLQASLAILKDGGPKATKEIYTKN